MRIQVPAHSKLLSRDFTFGVATAAFQIEGANTADGRLPSIWDTFCNEPNRVKNGDDGSVACDHYHRWQEDIDLIESLNVDAYRLSIAWPRVMDAQGAINPKGMAFYRKLLQGLKAKGIKTYVTLYHWDLPQYLEDKGGWLNRETAYAFAHYAELTVSELSPWVDTWATFNEPYCAAILGYEEGIHAPGKTSIQAGRQAAHHILLAHGLAVPRIRKQAKNATVGIVLNMNRTYPASKSSDDVYAAAVRDTLDNHFFISPLLQGRYPKLLDTELSAYKPLIAEGDLETISAPIDFLGLNYYTCNHNRFDAQHRYADVKNPNQNNIEYTDIGWEVCPQGFTELLVELNSTYKLPPLFITENGAATADQLEQGQVHDTQRLNYLNSHLNAVHDAIELGVDVRGYFAWSLMDNFEWAEGYSKRFGLVYVDYTSQTRTIKDSGLAYKAFISQR